MLELVNRFSKLKSENPARSSVKQTNKAPYVVVDILGPIFMSHTNHDLASHRSNRCTRRTHSGYIKGQFIDISNYLFGPRSGSLCC